MAQAPPAGDAPPDDDAPPSPSPAEGDGSGAAAAEAPSGAAAHPTAASAGATAEPARGEGEGASKPEDTAVAAAPASVLSASAPAFVPGGSVHLDGANAAGGEGEDGNILALLPASHRARLRGCFATPSGEWIAYYVGCLKSYNMRTGYGFLECAQSHAAYGADVFIHKNNVPNPWHIGQPVEFAVICNGRGQPQATDVNWLPRLPPTIRAPTAEGAVAPADAGAPAAAEERPRGGAIAGAARAAAGAAAMSADAVAGGAPAGAPPAMGPGAGPSAAAAAGPAAAPARLAVSAEQRCLGTLKSYSPAQGYGFIVCEEIFQAYQRDTYFNKSQLSAAGWAYGQTVEFVVAANARGQPQARQIDWDPVPHFPAPAPADARPEGGAAAAGGGRRTHAAQTLATLRKLLRLLSENPESAVITAIDLQGGSHSSGGAEAEADRDVDFVAFVLDRLGPEAEAAAATLKDFVKMLLLLMLAKMLRTERPQPRCQQLVRWFEALAQTIQPTGERVQEHFRDVVGQIDSHLQHASRENPRMAEEAQTKPMSAAFRQLQGKASSLGGPGA